MNIKTIASFSFGPILGAFLGFITLPLIAWLFPQEDIGRFTMYQAMLGFGIMLFSLAMHQAYVREYYEVEDKGLLLRLCILPGGLFFLLFSLVFILSPLSLSALIFDTSSLKLDLLMLGGLLLSFLINMLVHVLRMQGRGVAFSIAEVMPKMIHLAFIVLAVIILLDYDFNELVISNVIALSATLLTLIFLLRDDVKAALHSYYDSTRIKAMLAFSLPLVVGSLSYWALTTMDRFFLRSLAGFDELGLYAVTVSIASVATVLSTIFSSIWHPTVYRWMSEGIQVEKVQTVIDYTFIAILCVWSMAGAFSWTITYLLPNEYYSVKYLVVACIAMPLLYMLSEATVVGIGVTRRSLFSMLASVISLIANLLLNYLMIPKYGATGAAITSALAFALFFIIRTESSCYVWKPIRRKKIYILLFLYLIVTALFVFQKFENENIAFASWAALLIFTVGIYFGRIKHALNVFKDKIESRNG